MKIATADREIKEIIDKHHVYGAEVLINAIVRAARRQPYLGQREIQHLVERAFEREEAGDE